MSGIVAEVEMGVEDSDNLPSSVSSFPGAAGNRRSIATSWLTVDERKFGMLFLPSICVRRRDAFVDVSAEYDTPLACDVNVEGSAGAPSNGCGGGRLGWIGSVVKDDDGAIDGTKAGSSCSDGFDSNDVNDSSESVE